jgi:hypothetical protein
VWWLLVSRPSERRIRVVTASSSSGLLPSRPTLRRTSRAPVLGIATASCHFPPERFWVSVAGLFPNRPVSAYRWAGLSVAGLGFEVVGGIPASFWRWSPVKGVRGEGCIVTALSEPETAVHGGAQRVEPGNRPQSLNLGSL